MSKGYLSDVAARAQEPKKRHRVQGEPYYRISDAEYLVQTLERILSNQKTARVDVNRLVIVDCLKFARRAVPS